MMTLTKAQVLEPLLKATADCQVCLFELKTTADKFQEVSGYFRVSLPRFWTFQNLVDLKIFESKETNMLLLIVASEPCSGDRECISSHLKLVLSEMEAEGLVAFFDHRSGHYELVE